MTGFAALPLSRALFVLLLIGAGGASFVVAAHASRLAAAGGMRLQCVASAVQKIPRELVARVRAVLRRTQPEDPGTITVGSLTVDTARHAVTIDGRPVDPTPREFAILAALARAPGRVFSREALRERAFGRGSESLDRTVDAHIVKLRRKLAAAAAGAEAPRVETVFGVGYRLTPPETAPG